MKELALCVCVGMGVRYRERVKQRKQQVQRPSGSGELDVLLGQKGGPVVAAQRCWGRVEEFHKAGRSWVMQDLISHRKDIVFILKTMGNHGRIFKQRVAIF